MVAFFIFNENQTDIGCEVLTSEELACKRRIKYGRKKTNIKNKKSQTKIKIEILGTIHRSTSKIKIRLYPARSEYNKKEDG